MKKNLPLITIFGRTNVGKSTLFNCLTERRQALVADIEGTTRDCNLATVSWRGVDLELADTGGILDLDFLTAKKKKTDDIEAKVQQQAVGYLKKSDLVLFVVDNKTGILPQDRLMALTLKKILPNLKNVMLVVNKVDSTGQRARSAEFHKLAMGEPNLVSAVTGSGTGDLLDEIIKKLKIKKNKNIDSSSDAPDTQLKKINVCIMGKPNVGKSSLINSILGYERVITSPVAHTTREPQNTEIEYSDHIINLVDTAGISKKAQLNSRRELKGVEMLQKYGIDKSLGTLRRADIVLMVLDINEEITHQDAQIVEELVERRKSLIIVANKWDLVEERDTKKFNDYIYDHLPFVRWAPIQYTSAMTGEKINKILDLIIKIDQERHITIPDSELNTFLMKIIKKHKPAKAKGLKHPYIFKFEQTGSNPPRFEIRIGAKDTLHFSYTRFMENRLREKWGFTGTPLRFEVVNNKNVHGAHSDRPGPRRPKKRAFRNKKF